MPPTEPGKLSREETVAVLAYMLWCNGLPIGEASLGTTAGSQGTTFNVVLAGDDFDCTPRGELSLKGVHFPVRVFEVAR